LESSVKKRVAVTGLGIVSPLGIGVEANWEALMAGRSGIGPITKFDATGFKSRVAGEVKGFNPEDFLEKKAIKRMDDFIQFAVAAARMAMQDSGLVINSQNENLVGCVVGCGLGGLATIEKFHSILLERGPDRISPFLIPMLIGNMAAGQISIELGAKGPNLCISTACAAGTHAVGQSFKLIQDGTCRAVVTGGVESVVTPLGVGGFAAMKALSTRNDEPEKSSRPFEKDRDGFVVGEGAGIIILEEMESALERGATVYGEVIGFGMSGDAFHMTAPPEGHEGAVRCILAALADAGVTPDQVDHINAHGTSTEINDLYETQAIKTVFGDRAKSIPISATKSMTGHLLGAAGGVESIFTVLSLRNGIAPPTINYETPDPNCDLDYVPNKPRPVDMKIAVSNSFGFGGTNGALVFRASEE
jgi:3-oxoacyl-[acyl-carrier-protein] synthase II